MTEFIDLIYCSNLDGRKIIACAPMSACIKEGDIVCIDRIKDFYLVSCKTCVSKDSETYKFINEAFGDTYDGLHEVTGKYSYQKIGGSEYE